MPRGVFAATTVTCVPSIGSDEDFRTVLVVDDESDFRDFARARFLTVDARNRGEEVIGLEDASNLLGSVTHQSAGCDYLLCGSVLWKEHEGDAECDAQRVYDCAVALHSHLLYETEDSEIAQRFLCPSVQKAPNVIAGGRGIVWIVFHADLLSYKAYLQSCGFNGASFWRCRGQCAGGHMIAA
jgi:hypothetical protein